MTHPNRYNIYSNIHKALRAFMADTLQLCGRTDWADAEEGRDTLAQVSQLMMACLTHLQHEDEFLHTAMEARRPASSMTTATDHHEHVLAIKAFLTDVQALAETPAVLRAPLGAGLYRRLALFVAENYEHMAVEETDNAAVLQACYSDAEIHDIEARLVAHVPQEMMPVMLRWMLPALNAQERALMLGGMRQNAPAEAFDGVMGMVRPLLSERDWRKLDRALGCEAALTA